VNEFEELGFFFFFLRSRILNIFRNGNNIIQLATVAVKDVLNDIFKNLFYPTDSTTSSKWWYLGFIILEKRENVRV